MRDTLLRYHSPNQTVARLDKGNLWIESGKDREFAAQRAAAAILGKILGVSNRTAAGLGIIACRQGAMGLRGSLIAGLVCRGSFFLRSPPEIVSLIKIFHVHTISCDLQTDTKGC